jgi:hypothetical protein
MMQSDGRSRPVLCGGVGASVVRLGKLQVRSVEDFVIETSPVPRENQHASLRDACNSHDLDVSGLRRAARTGLEDLDTSNQDIPILEDDLSLQECSSDEEGIDVQSNIAMLAPGSNKPRQLMEARSQQCVICLTDKAHTIVPPHRHESAQQVEGHRICTECWSNFLYHGLRQPSRDGRGPPPLACPLCRGTIDVPDAWATFIELPPSWQQPKTAVQGPIPCLSTCTPTSSSESHVWWQRGTDSEGSECEKSTVGGDAQAACEADSALLRGGWRSLRCPMFGFFSRGSVTESRQSSPDSIRSGCSF